jgi:NADH-quinone oxidoreductase subunit J
MNALFYTAAAVAMLCTVKVITHVNPMHALLYLITSLLAVALVFYALGAPLVAALEVIIYAGAIMVLFVFVIMMLSPGAGEGTAAERARLLLACAGPAVLALLLVGELIYVLAQAGGTPTGPPTVGPEPVAVSLFGPYLLGLELASILLLGALVGAYHLARRGRVPTHDEGEV